MGIFNALKRLATGQLPFESPKNNADHSDQQDSMSQAGATPQARGPKVTPRVEIERTTSRTTGQQMQVTCSIQNNSQNTIELDKIRLLGTSLELDSFLRPGEERQYNVYNGNRPQNMNYRTAELYYKDQSGDYFCYDHNIEYQRESDGTYVIEDMRPMRVRDV